MKDLFESLDLLPQPVYNICMVYCTKAAEVGLDYNDCKEWRAKLNVLGYDFEYGLDAEPFNLHKMQPISETKRVVVINVQYMVELPEDITWDQAEGYGCDWIPENISGGVWAYRHPKVMGLYMRPVPGWATWDDSKEDPEEFAWASFTDH